MATDSALVGAYQPDRGQLRAMVAVATLACLLALGPLVSAIVNSVEIEVAIGAAAHLPVPELLPGALDPVAGIALLVLAALRPGRALRAWCWFLVAAVLMAAMAAGGGHAVFATDVRGELVLPPPVAFAVSAVPAASAAATAHLVLLVVARLVDLRRLLRRSPAQESAREPEVRSDPPVGLRTGRVRPRRRRRGGPRAQRLRRPSGAPELPPAQDRGDAAHPAVLAALEGGRGYRTVMTATGWARPRAEAALRAAREATQ